MHGPVRRAICFGYGHVRAGEGSVSSTILEARKGIAEPRHLLSGVPPPRSGAVQRLLPKVHGQVFASLPWRHRHRRQGVASFLRQGQRQVAAPHGLRLGLRSAPRAGADRHGRQVERDHRRSAIVEALVAKGNHCDRRHAQLSARDRPANHRSGWRLRLRAQGQSRHAAHRCRRVPRRSADQGHDGTYDGRRRSWPHRNSRHLGLDRHRLAAGTAPMAGPGSDRKSYAHTRDRRKISTETAYYLFSTPITAERGGEVVRSHWGVENRLHWRLDVTMNEDAARNRMDNGPHNLAVLRHMALNVMGREESKTSLRAKFKKAAWNHDYLVKLLALF